MPPPSISPYTPRISIRYSVDEITQEFVSWERSTMRVILRLVRIRLKIYLVRVTQNVHYLARFGWCLRA
jgi:hypothetical protein